MGDSADHTLRELIERSRRLGSDRSICNWGGGNTSVKTTLADWRGRQRPAMWVKASGHDLAEAGPGSFTPLFLDDVLPLMTRDQMTDDEMMAYLEHCTAGPRHPRPSIETLLHAFLPFRHVDHTHPDAILSLACTPRADQVVRAVFGDDAVYVPYLRPGFALSRLIAEQVRLHRCRLAVMGKHGMVTWGETSAEAEENCRTAIARAREYLDGRRPAAAFGGPARAALPADERRRVAAAVMPRLRGLLSSHHRQVLAFDDSPDVLEWVCARDGQRVARVGAACPDHLLHTRRVPLWVNWEPGDSAGALVQALEAAVPRFADDYTAYWRAFAGGQEPAGDPLPRIVLVPGLGMFTAGRNRFMAEVSAQLAHRAIAVSAGAEAVDRYSSLTPEEAYHVEHWPLELYKLARAGPEPELARRVALVTGGAGGIGRAICQHLARAGCHVLVADLNAAGAAGVAADLSREFGPLHAEPLPLDVSREESVQEAFRTAVLAFGGIDIVVNNAGFAVSHPVEETSLAEWQKVMDVLATGYFLVAREAFRVMTAQQLGGSLVFVASKSALLAGRNVPAYSAAKAAEAHLARCLAEEGGSRGIRVNTVCPDAVIQGSGIFHTAYRAERARAYGIAGDQLEEYYRRRTALKVNVLPEDVAEAVLFLASDRSAKTTGCLITVDGGIQAAYPR